MLNVVVGGLPLVVVADINEINHILINSKSHLFDVYRMVSASFDSVHCLVVACFFAYILMFSFFVGRPIIINVIITEISVCLFHSLLSSYYNIWNKSSKIIRQIYGITEDGFVVAFISFSHRGTSPWSWSFSRQVFCLVLPIN